ncbi:MAG: hypothetical protein ACTSRU_12985 [Candidatus Hodarchaeales archaeon]
MEGDDKEYDFSRRIIKVPYSDVEPLPLGDLPNQYMGEDISPNRNRNISYIEVIWRLARKGMSVIDMTSLLSTILNRDDESTRENIRTNIRRLKRDGWSFYPCNSKKKEFIMLCGRGVVPRYGITTERIVIKKKGKKRKKRKKIWKSKGVWEG